MKLDTAIEVIVRGPQTDEEKTLHAASMDTVRQFMAVPDVSKLADLALELHTKQGVPLLHAIMVGVQVGYQVRQLTESDALDAPTVNAAEIVDKTLTQLGLRSQSTH
jgi:hypothetical protein